MRAWIICWRTLVHEHVFDMSKHARDVRLSTISSFVRYGFELFSSKEERQCLCLIPLTSLMSEGDAIRQEEAIDRNQS